MEQEEENGNNDKQSDQCDSPAFRKSETSLRFPISMDSLAPHYYRRIHGAHVQTQQTNCQVDGIAPVYDLLFHSSILHNP
jgi:hypothetical protein